MRSRRIANSRWPKSSAPLGELPWRRVRGSRLPKCQIRRRRCPIFRRRPCRWRTIRRPSSDCTPDPTNGSGAFSRDPEFRASWTVPGCIQEFFFYFGSKNGPTFFLSPTQANISCGAIKLPAGSEVRLVEFVGKFYGTGKVSEIK